MLARNKSRLQRLQHVTFFWKDRLEQQDVESENASCFQPTPGVPASHRWQCLAQHRTVCRMSVTARLKHVLQRGFNVMFMHIHVYILFKSF